VTAFAAPERRTLLGFDYGTRRVGVAVGQTVTGSASPLAVLKAPKSPEFWQQLDRLMSEWRPDGLVVGLPLQADGSAGAIARATDAFADELTARYGLTVVRVDERLTSWEADRVARDVPESRRDAVAASLILMTYLEGRSP
jgi:putative Holliday junction resolvase